MARGQNNTPLTEVITGTLYEAGGCDEAQDEYLLAVGPFNEAISEIPEKYHRTAFCRVRMNGEGPAYIEIGYRK